MIRFPNGRQVAGPSPARRRREADPGRSSPEPPPNRAREASGFEEVNRPPEPGRKPPMSPRPRTEVAGSSPELKLIVGVSRKRGLPGFGSVGASCGLEIRAEPWASDPEQFEARVREAFDACARAVDDQLDRSQTSTHEPGNTPREDHRPERGERPSTPAQVRALHALARRLDLDLDALVLRRFNSPAPEALSLVQASRLITELQPPAPDDSP